MSRIRKRDTRPEIATRSVLHRLGYRFRVNVRSLPGTPDVAIKSRKVAILIHGCFWHSHQGCRLNRPPKRNTEYWNPKLRRNRARDVRVSTELKALGYRVLVVWECEVADSDTLTAKLASFMQSASGVTRGVSSG
ncbi:very short patch repair endonuclease [Hypericibacter sp.]|uniref:very short patch repair endonuclease n=1 Tax=Hypericibacter sp. TaxID=2705401 RepID=UPI003D6D122D